MKKIFITTFVSFGLYILSGCTNTALINSPVSPNNSPSQTDKEKNLILVEGIVEDIDGKPVSGANIVIKDDKKIIAQTKTDSLGKFSVKVEKTFSDSYFIEASKNLSDGSLNQTLLISSGQKANFTGTDSLKKTTLAQKPVSAG